MKIVILFLLLSGLGKAECLDSKGSNCQDQQANYISAIGQIDRAVCFGLPLSPCAFVTLNEKAAQMAAWSWQRAEKYLYVGELLRIYGYSKESTEAFKKSLNYANQAEIISNGTTKEKQDSQKAAERIKKFLASRGIQ